MDDGDDAISDLVPKDDRIHYFRLEKPLRLRAKRNFACNVSKGDLIAHWDDDDWMAPNRISKQVTQLLSSQADLCGASELLYYRCGAGDAWLYSCQEEMRAWVKGGTMLYYRSVWESENFPEIDVGEDSALVFSLKQELSQ